MNLITASKLGNLHLIRTMLQQQQVGATGGHTSARSHDDRERPESPHRQLRDDDSGTSPNGDANNNTTNSKKEVLYEALLAASQYGYLDVVKCLVEQGKAKLFHNEDHSSPLHVACAMGRSEVAVYLTAAARATSTTTNGLIEGDNSLSLALRHLDREGYPPHIAACCNGNMEIARYLMEKFAHIISVDQGYGADCLAPLHWAARINHAELATFLLNTRNAHANLKAAYSQTPLHLACRRQLVNRSAPRNATPVVDILLQHGADLYAINDDGNTPLLEAVRWNQVDVVDCLLEYMHYYSITGSSRSNRMNHVNKEGHNALSLACRNKNYKIVHLLLLHGACVFNAQGWQALTAACQRNDTDIVRLLVEARLGQQQPSPLGRGNQTSSGKRKRRPDS
ncbi:hypothetical protein ACA910_021063 [Epithemia clementina (nom. ined.)]